jgi:parallel beta-helix repeat protein
MRSPSVLVLCLAACTYQPLRLERSDGPGPEPSLVVVPVYPAHGANWNDYVARTHATAGDYGQPDLPCDAEGAGGYAACLHGGELRQVLVPGESECTPLSIHDALDAWDWICADGTEGVRYLSTGLRGDKGLADLLDFPNATWRPNSVTVSKEGRPILGSAPEVWWANPVVPLPDNRQSARVVLEQAGAIFVLPESRATNGYNINADRIALVTAPDAVLSYGASDEPNCQPGTGEPVSPSQICLVAAGAERFLWIEGKFSSKGDGVDAVEILSLDGLRSSVVRRVTGVDVPRTGVWLGHAANNRIQDLSLTGSASGQDHGLTVWESDANTFLSVTVRGSFYHGVELVFAEDNTLIGVDIQARTHGLLVADSSRNAVEDLTVTETQEIGVYVRDSSDNRFESVRIASTGEEGLRLQTARGNYLHGLRVANTGNEAITVAVGSQDNVLTNLHLANSSYEGIWLVDPGTEKNTIVGVTCTNTLSCVGIADGASRNTITHVTAANGGGTAGLLPGGGIDVGGVDNSDDPPGADPTLRNVLSQLVVLNSANNGVSIRGDETVVAQIAVSGSDNAGIEVASTDNTFRYGLLFGLNLGGDCSIVGGPPAPGLDGNCSPTGSPDGTPRQVADLAGSFVGKVTADDADNASDQAGVAVAAQIEDWLSFASRFRGWGRDGAIVLDDSNRGQCSGSETCSIWDWRLRAADTILRNTSSNGMGPNSEFLANTVCPGAAHGDVVLSDDQGRTFLVNAQELIGDGPGDDDGLCESDEACLYSPNFGAYQGEGELLGPCLFENGAVDGVTLYAQSVNGV